MDEDISLWYPLGRMDQVCIAIERMHEASQEGTMAEYDLLMLRQRVIETRQAIENLIHKYGTATPQKTPTRQTKATEG